MGKRDDTSRQVDARVRGGALPATPTPEALMPEALRRQLTPKARAFLVAFVVHGTVLGAAQAAGVHRSQHYVWLEESPAYARAFALAKEAFVETLERAVIQRARDGVLRPIYQGGKRVGEELVFSDRLAELLLKAHRPEKYREQLEHLGADGRPLAFQVVMYDRPRKAAAKGARR